MWGWDFICSATRKIDRTVREDVPAKLKQYTPDPKQLQHVARYCAGSYPAEKLSDIQKIMQGNWDSVCFVARKIGKTVRENASDQRIFWTTSAEEIIKDSSLPGVRPLCTAGKESRRNRSGVASQMHSQGKVNGERISTDERGKNIDGEKCMMLQPIFIPTAPPKSTARKICSAARKIDRTVREDVPAMLKQYTPDPKQLQHVAEKIGKAVRENAPDPRIFGPIFVEEIIKDSGLPGVRPLCRAWKESRRNRSGVATQMHSQDKVNGERISTDERERAKREKCMMLRSRL